MKRYFSGFLVLAAALLVLSTAGGAQATTLQTCPAAPAPCTIDTSSTVVGGGDFTTGPLTFAAGAVVTTTGALTIHVQSTAVGADDGDLIMNANSGIDANNPGGCPRRGFAVTLDVQGDITTVPSSFIRSNSCSGGDIVITNGAHNIIDIDGLVESVGSGSGTGGNQAPGGGPITITSSCGLTITPDGKVSSRGKDPGADLVRLQAGCDLHIFGLVESTGKGHSQPTNPPNHCALGTHVNATACVLLVAGGEVVVDGKAPNKGEVNADIGPAPGEVPWIDIFARGPIKLLNDLSGPFVVHAGNNGGSNNVGGDVTVKSRDDGVTATGLAISANATGGGGDGGHVVVHAKLDVDLAGTPGGVFEARGSKTGGTPTGGKIEIQSFGTAPNSGSILGVGGATPSTLDVTGGVNPGNGIINLTACGTIAFPPGIVIPATVVPTKATGVCGGNPVIPAFALTNGDLPVCACIAEACVRGTASKGAGAAPVTVNGEGLKTVVSVSFGATCAGGAGVGTNLQVNGAGTILTVDPPAGVTGPNKVILNLGNGSAVCLAGTVNL